MPDEVDLVITDALVAIEVVHVEGDAQLLKFCAHGGLEHEADKLVVVDALVAIFVDLRNESATNDFW